MRSFRHWTPRYILDRLKQLAYERRHPDAPWLTRDMVQILSSWLRPEDKGLEWGSGRSTLWFAQRSKWLMSIEHDDSWYCRTKAKIEEKGIRNVDYRLCKKESEYVSMIEQLQSASLDFALVDGMVRDQCALAAISMLKPGGIIVLDNSNWYLPCASRSPNSRRSQDGAASDTWKMFMEQVKDWRCVWTTNGVWDTTLWVKDFR